MFSLASFRYRNVLAQAGGPVERLEIAHTTVLGQPVYLANAYLVPGLAGSREGNVVYGRANGSGTDTSPMVARFKAISEALERWAHWQTHRASGRERYGFDVDPSSTGLAAFPGLWRRQARPGALLEAAERFNLLNWWEGGLSATESATHWPGVRAAVIRSEAPGVTVILFRRTDAGCFAYGHAAAMNFETACTKAAVEMERHGQVVGKLAQAHGGKLPDMPASAHPLERRSVYFAREEGHARFLERLQSPQSHAAKLKLAYDGPVPGPWTPYADVWRVAYEPPSRRFLGLEEDYFMI